ncbi:MAG: thiamine-phosphate kinase [Thermotogae bacterium]|nr:thiamine-phosphate kinase [Thermotogota bacterium]
MREDDLIRALTERFSRPHPRIKVGVGDDCSVLRQNPGRDLVVSVDTAVEDVHFNLNILSYKEVGYRALAGAMSDVAAMGGEPLAFLVNLQTPREYIPHLKKLYEGFIPLSEKFCTPLVGGNLSRGKDLALTIIVLGEVPRKNRWMRSGAREGDVLFVTGDVGRVKAFFLSRNLNPTGKEWWYKKLRQKVVQPVPRLHEVERIRAEGVEVSAAIDISDGLAIDSYRVAQASDVRIVLDLQVIPIDDSVRYVAENLNKDIHEVALSSGEEYELLLSVPQRWASKMERMGFIPIGKVELGPVGLQDEKGKAITPIGWQHF